MTSWEIEKKKHTQDQNQILANKNDKIKDSSYTSQ